MATEEIQEKKLKRAQQYKSARVSTLMGSVPRKMAWLAEARRCAEPRLAPRASRLRAPHGARAEMSDSAPRRLGPGPVQPGASAEPQHLHCPKQTS